MKKMEWNDSLSLGIDEIDNQHKTWIAKFNDVLEAVAAGQTQERIISTLDFLADYTDTHFATEEKFMAAMAFAGLPDHQAKHADLKATVADMVRDFREDGVSQQLANAIQTLLNNWLIKHIQEMDRAYADAVRDA